VILKILHISKLNSKAAGIAAYNLHFALKKNGHNSKIIVEFDSDHYDNEGVISYYSAFIWFFNRYYKKIYNRTIGKFKKNKIDTKYNPHSLNELVLDISVANLKKKVKMKPEVIFIYFTHSFINTKIIRELYDFYKVPIYWYFMDMAPMTGGCHFAWDCEGYKDVCGNCPALFSSDPNDITFKNLAYKKNNLKNIELRLIIGADWLINKAKESSLFKNVPINKIMLPVNEDIFFPKDKKEARNKLGLPQNKKIFFFGAQSLRDPRKGIIKIVEAFNLINNNPAHKEIIDNFYIFFAGDYPEIVKDKLKIENKYFGLLANDESLASVYQAADFFISASLQDTGPYMIIEAISCGIPVISFNMGLAYEFVTTGETGYKVGLGDSNDLAQGIIYAAKLSSQDYLRMSENCSSLANKYLRRGKQVELITGLLNEIK